MKRKSFVLFIIALVLFGLSFSSLIAAMIVHAVKGDGAVAASIVAGCSAAAAFLGIIFVCLSGRKNGEKNENAEV